MWLRVVRVRFSGRLGLRVFVGWTVVVLFRWWGLDWWIVWFGSCSSLGCIGLVAALFWLWLIALIWVFGLCWVLDWFVGFGVNSVD